jgi:iron complex outermembrane receptor protein
MPLVLGLIALTSLSTFATENPTEEGDEHLVIVTKRPKPMDDLGFSIQVVNEENLNSLDAAESLSDYLSGVQTVISNGSQTTFQIRGIGAIDHQALTPTATAVYVDGVYLATNVQASPLLFDLARAEVIKGPQGALYGRNASAGAIQFISNAPGEDQALKLKFGYGDFNRQDMAVVINQPVSDKLSLRFAGRSLSRDPVLDNILTNPGVSAPAEAAGVADEFGARFSARYLYSEQTSIIFRTHYSEDNGINPAPLNSSLTDTLDDHQISIGLDGIQDTDNEFQGTSISIQSALDDFQLDLVLAYEGYNQQYGFDFDGTPAPFELDNLNANLSYDRNFSQTSTEVRLSSVTEQAEWMLGAYLAEEDFDQSYFIWCGELDRQAMIGSCPYVGAPGRTGSNPASATDVMSLLSIIEQTRETAALFTFNTIELTEQVDIVIGGRYTYERISGQGLGLHYFADGTEALNNRDDLGAAEGSNTITENNFTANLGLNYQITDHHLAYVSLANGFKSGGFNGEVINNATHFSDEGLFGSETVTSLEFGLKSRIDSLSYKLSAFFMNYDDPQVRIFVPFTTVDGGSFISNSLANLEEAQSNGIDMNLDWLVTDNFRVSTDITYLDTEINQTVQPDVPQNAEIFDGNSLPFASDLSAVLLMDYDFALAESIAASVRFSAKYQDDFYLDAEGLEDRKQGAYSIYNAAVNLYLQNGFDVSFWAKNLANAQYATSGYGFIGYNTFLGAPRTYGLTISYGF